MKPVLLAVGFAVMAGATPKSKTRLIIDTDMLNFDDDPMAIGLANIFQNWGEVELIGVMSSMSHFHEILLYE